MTATAEPLAPPPSSLAPDPSPRKRKPGFWGERLDGDAPETPWLWDGYTAPGQVTILTSQWKSGKTTLLSILLSRFKNGGALAERAVTATRPIVVSEEPEELWRPRHRQLDLRHVYFLCRPFTGKPTLAEWLDLIDQIAELRREHGLGFLAIDTISTLFPGGSENNADCAMRAMLPLQKLTAEGMAVWLQHHPKKGACLPGQAARGSGAFGGNPDVVMEMHRCPHGGEEDRRRRLIAFSRSARTPRQVVLELNADGTDYRNLGDFAVDEFLSNWERLRVVLEDAAGKLTRREILAQWPADYPRPADTSLYCWLCRAAGLGLIAQGGAGRRNDPFRYWLPGHELPTAAAATDPDEIVLENTWRQLRAQAAELTGAPAEGPMAE